MKYCCQESSLISSLFIAMGLGEGVGIEGELGSFRSEIRSPVKGKEVSLGVGRLNTSKFLPRFGFITLY